jgi:hypothetical protein
MYREGTIIRVIEVAKRMPKPSEMAIGIIKRACLEVSKIMGARPPKVVKVVNIMGLNRLTPA